MSEGFKQSEAAWKQCAEKAGYEYQLWGPAEVQKLIEDKYPEKVKMYEGLPYGTGDGIY